jgi:hypothetical protein
MLKISSQNINALISALKSEKLTLFTTYQLMLFLTSSLSIFNQIPPLYKTKENERLECRKSKDTDISSVKADNPPYAYANLLPIGN